MSAAAHNPGTTAGQGSAQEQNPPRTCHPKRSDVPEHSDDSADDAGPRVYFCHARTCPEFFTSVAARGRHARDHEHDADQEHLAAYFYCSVSGSFCEYSRPVFDDPNVRRRRSRGPRKDEVGTHLSRSINHVGMAAARRAEEKAVAVMRTRMARQNLGLSEVSAEATALPAHAAVLMPPSLP